MKITHTDIYQYSIPMVPFTIATGTMEYAQNVLIQVHTDQGIGGWGEGSAFPMIVGETQETCLAVGRDFARIFKGREALDIPARLSELDAFIAGNTTIKSAFDMALYDIASQAASQPLYRYLGGELKPVTTDITVGIGTPEQMATQAKAFQKQGATVLKVKVGKSADGDIARIRAIRQAVGPDIKIRLDANQGWDLAAAVKALSAMEALNIEFCEQPLRSYDDHEIRTLKSKVKIPLMADESCYHSRDVAHCKAAGFDYINIKLAKSGGIHQGLEIARRAADLAVPCMMGGMLESRVALTAMTHLAMASENILFYDMDTCLLGHRSDPVKKGVEIEAFRLRLPDPNRPGIGVEMDQDFLEQCTKWTI